MKRSMWRRFGVGAVLLATVVGLSWQAFEARSDSSNKQAESSADIKRREAIQIAVENRLKQVEVAQQAGNSDRKLELLPLVKAALADDSPAAREATRQLRAAGPHAVRFLYELKDLHFSPRYRAVFDEVAQQKDAVFSGLYWHTDLDAALKAAREENKPVLSLRLLGPLTDELSCANSRFFRTTLYPNPVVRDLLDQKYVLHWQSVRPVPVITIDFPDGRQIQQTITGNSLHLVLDADGRAIEVLPGLYGPGEFSRQLGTAAAATARLSKLQGAEFEAQFREFHRDRMTAMAADWETRCKESGIALTLEQELSDAQWQTLASTYQAESVPVGAALAAVHEKGAVPRERKNGKPGAREAAAVAMTKSVVELPHFANLKMLSESIALDTVKNEFQLHRQIHLRMANEPIPTRDALVESIYESLFLSPLSDPWYGLSQPDVYSALPQNGRINAVTQNSRR